MPIPAPSWFLLFWCGLAAALASEFIVALARATLAHGQRSTEAGPRLMSAPRTSIPFAVLSGAFVFAPLYGIAFEWLARADLQAGAAIGAIHGVIAGVAVLFAAFRRRAGSPARSLKPMLGFRARRLLTRALFGALLGFLYVVPGA
jgi:hypothetical protein